MASPQEQRKIRLGNDYTEMKNIKGAIVDWKAIRGTEPYVEEYELTINIRSIVSASPNYHNTFRMKVTLPDTYPFSAPPLISMISTPYPFHPNWFTSGRWCYGTWIMSESLGHHIIRMIRTLQYDTEITNEHSPANGTANDWYVSQRNRGLFPCDTTTLPDPTKMRFNTNEGSVVVKPKFNISGGNSNEPPPKRKFDIK